MAPGVPGPGHGLDFGPVTGQGLFLFRGSKPAHSGGLERISISISVGRLLFRTWLYDDDL